MRRFATDLTVNVLGLASLSNWQYMLAKSSYMFVRKRHGNALDRSARIRAYAQLQYSLKFDSSLDPELRGGLEQKLQGLGLNPLGIGLNSEMKMARGQHAALLEWAASPGRAGAGSAAGSRARACPAEAFPWRPHPVRIGTYRVPRPLQSRRGRNGKRAESCWT